MACSLSYSLSLTGDCSNNETGAFSLEIFGTAPDYTIQWINPSGLGTVALGPGVTGYTLTDLPSDTYTFNLIDSCEPNNVIAINAYISNGTCVSIINSENTLCNQDNGSIVAKTSTLYGPEAKFYLYDSVYGYVTSASTEFDNYTFQNLSASTYYVIGDDGGGCTGQSETVIILDSTNLDYTLYVVNDAGCAVNSGKIFVNDIIGTPPFTYLWSNGATTSSITNLSAGSYFVTVTDSSGCVVTKTATVQVVPPVGIVTVFTDGPSCFESNGEVTVYISGGTAPYYYSGSTATNNGPSFDTNYTFTNLGSGLFDIKVTDAGLCNAITSVYLTTPGSFSVVSVTSTNSTCSNDGGSISINLFGGTQPYIYTLSKIGGSTTTQTTNSTNWSFENLTSGTYTLTIQDGGECVYTTEIVINNTVLFELSATTTGTTCGLNDGSVTISVSGSTPIYTYVLDDELTVSVAFSSATFTNLTSGPHTVNVTDGTGCSQDIQFLIDASSGVDFVMVSTDSTNGTNGTISAYVTNGEPPFTLEWSENVNGQTGFDVNSLSAGTYTLKITDDNGCIKIRTVVVDGNTIQESYQIYSVCESDLTNTGMLLTKGPKQMLLEGFYDLNTGNTNCVLNEAIFEAVVTISGVTKTDSFFTGNTLTEYPTIEEWTNVIEEIIMTYDGISGVTFNISKNLMTITTDCESEVSFNDAGVVINMKIYYDISCQSCTGCYTPEFTPISCEITEEYCETTETKVIYPNKLDFFGSDYLNNLSIIPDRCTELPNYLQCEIGDVVGSEFRELRDAYYKYQSDYNYYIVTGRITEANNLPVVLPPTRYEGDYFNDGPDNIGWVQYNILKGCSCKKIFEEEGLVGPQYDFEINYLTEVQSYGDLPLTSSFGTFCFVIDDGEFYTWDPTTNTWVVDGTIIPGFPDANFCGATQRDQRDAYLKVLNQMTLALKPFTWASFHIPLYQIFKYKM